MVTEINPDHLTWTNLLAQCLRLAQASVAFPKNEQGDRWRASVPAIINLTAVTFALSDFARIAPDERALALDKAELLIQSASGELTHIWNSRLSPSLEEVILDAHSALTRARAHIEAGATSTHPNPSAHDQGA